MADWLRVWSLEVGLNPPYCVTLGRSLNPSLLSFLLCKMEYSKGFQDDVRQNWWKLFAQWHIHALCHVSVTIILIRGFLSP